ncbi:hypothetical protein QQ045_007007 [Rhodiola kirilowii]
MSDIAMLVAEEYERRMKNSRRLGVEDDEEKKLTVVSIDVNGVLEKVLKPRSQISLAASNGFFSA